MAITVSEILDMMTVLDRELETGSGEADESRSISAVNAAKRQLDRIISQHPKIMGDTVGAITTTANDPDTAFPAGVLRIDALRFIDPTTSRPTYWLLPDRLEGGPTGTYPYLSILDTSIDSTGKPRSYWTDGTNVYWNPLPNDTHTVRWYGYQVQDDATDRSSTFTFPDICIDPMANFAVMLINKGLDDDVVEHIGLASDLFEPAVMSMKKFWRDGPSQFRYREYHTE